MCKSEVLLSSRVSKVVADPDDLLTPEVVQSSCYRKNIGAQFTPWLTLLLVLVKSRVKQVT